jgi:spore germination protein KC
MIRRAAMAAALGACLCLLTGCWGAPALDRQGMVSILGVDQGPHGTLRATVDIVNATGLPPPTSSGGGGNTGEPVIVRDGTGHTLGEALRHIADSSQMSLDLTHCQVIVAGRALARHGLADALEEVDRSGEITVTSWLLVTERGTAHNLLLATRDAPPQPGTALLETTQYSMRMSCCAAQRDLDFDLLSATPGYDFETAAVAPALGDGAGHRSGFEVRGTDLFRADRMVGQLTPDAALGYLLLSARIQAQQISVPSAYGYLSIVLRPVTRSIRVEHTAHGPLFHIVLKDKGRLVGLPVAAPDLSRSPAAAHKLDTFAAHYILTLAEEGLSQMRAAHSDPLGLGQQVRVQDPEDWQHEGATWDEVGFPAATIRIDVHFALTRSGTTLCPLTRTCGPVVTPTS